jgi:hypothetical protein
MWDDDNEKEPVQEKTQNEEDERPTNRQNHPA